MRDERIIRIPNEDVTRCLLCNLANRIEMAVKQESGNVAALRKALENLKQEAETTCEYMDYPIAGASGERGTCPVVDADWIIEECRAALSMPARNCDVGSPEEQAKRFNTFCAVHHFQSEKCCSGCPCHGADNCELKWGQMPYEERNAK